MALTPGTDTYATLAEANDYAGSLPFPGDWATASDAAKENALKTAARWLDTLQFRGIRSTSAQVLAWPRSGVWDADGYQVAADAVPTIIKTAQAELALRLLSDDRAADAGGLAPETLKLGSLELGKMRHQIIPASVLVMLRPYLASTSGMVGGRRG